MNPEAYYVKVCFVDGDRSSDTFQVQLKVGNQTFDVGPAWDTRSEAARFRRCLVHALHNIVQERLEELS